MKILLTGLWVSTFAFVSILTKDPLLASIGATINTFIYGIALYRGKTQ